MCAAKNITSVQQGGVLAGGLQGCSPRLLAQGLLSKPESSADISPKTPIAPYCAVPLLSAISRLLLLFDITIPNTLGAPALFAVEVILA